jgi:hypothetical protein
MVTPDMLPGMKQGGDYTTLRIVGHHLSRFPTIAVKTCQGKILKGGDTALRQWHNVINRKRDILPLLCSMTVLTEGLSTMAHLCLHGPWERTATGHSRGFPRAGEAA